MKKILQITTLALLLFVFLTPTALAETRTQTVNLTQGQSTAQINGKTVEIGVIPLIKNGTTLVPLRFVGEAFGFEVSWKSGEIRAVINT